MVFRSQLLSSQLLSNMAFRSQLISNMAFRSQFAILPFAINKQYGFPCAIIVILHRENQLPILTIDDHTISLLVAHFTFWC